MWVEWKDATRVHLGLSDFCYFQFFPYTRAMAAKFGYFQSRHHRIGKCATFRPVKRYVQPSDQLKDIMMLFCQHEQQQEQEHSLVMHQVTVISHAPVHTNTHRYKIMRIHPSISNSPAYIVALYWAVHPTCIVIPYCTMHKILTFQPNF